MSLFQSLLSQSRRSQNAGSPGVCETVRPTHSVTQTDESFALTVQLPGVTKEGLEITAEGGELRIAGSRAWKQPEGWSSLYRESTEAPFELVLAYEDAIDVEAIAAELNDGVLRLSLPKSAALKPRRIAVS